MSDPLFAQVVALMQAHTGTLTEATGLPTMTVVGDGDVSNEQVKFGTASFRNPGTNAQNTNYVLLEDAEDSQGLFVFPGELTFEGWFFPVAYSPSDAANMIAATDIQFPAVGSCQLSIEIGIPFHLTWNGAPPPTTAGSIVNVPLNQWSFIAMTRDAANVIQLWLNGTEVGSTTFAGAVGALNPLRSNLGICRGINSNHADLNCYFDQWRVTKACRYTSNFTPPDAPFPTSGVIPPEPPPPTCEEIGRATRAYVSAYDRSRVHQARLYRFEKRCLVANFNGAIPPPRTITSATWRTDAPEIGVISNPQISTDARETMVTFASQLGGWANLRSEVTLDNGEIYNQVFRVNVREASYFFNDPPSQVGPFSLTVTA